MLVLAFLISFATGKSLYAQTALPYFSGFDNATQKNGWQIFRKGDPALNNWQYAATVPYSGTDCIYHGYPVGGSVATDDWFVSPPFTITSNGKLDSLRYSFSGFGVPAVGDTLAIYIIKGNADPALATTKTIIHDFRGDKYTNDNTWRLLSNITIPQTTGTFYIAIRYKTINNWLDVKFDNFRVSGGGTTGVGKTDYQANALRVFPNPAKDMLNITAKQPLKEVIIADMNGKIVYRKPYTGKADLSSFTNGIYLMTCITTSGESIHRSFVKN